jgi:hypothetical protein
MTFAGADWGGHVFLCFHRIRHYRHDGGGGQQPQAVHSPGDSDQPDHHSHRLRHLLHDAHSHR